MNWLLPAIMTPGLIQYFFTLIFIKMLDSFHRKKSNATVGGFGFSEEMCVNYVHYFPRYSNVVLTQNLEEIDFHETN